MLTSRPRSLADDLRAREDAALVALLRARPDLLSPVPSDLASLAARATTRPSVTRAMDALDAFTLQVVDVLCALPDHSSTEDVRRLLGADPTAVLERLHQQALVYRDDEGALVLPRTVLEIVGPPAGLGPPAEQALVGYGPARLAQIAADLGLTSPGDPVRSASAIADVLADPDRLDALLESAPPGAADALGTLVWGPSTGQLERAARPVTVASAASPVEWLLARGILVATGAASVVLPREVAIHLRGDRVHRSPEPALPELEISAVDPDRVDRVAAGAAADVVRLVEELLELWSTEPPKVLRAGGVGVRERARAAGALDIGEGSLALLAEVASAAGLVAAGGEVDEVWLPTPAYDAWREQPTADRWGVLAEAWLASTRVPGLAGSQDVRGRTLAPLGPDLDRQAAPGIRAAVLADLTALPRGSAASTASVAARLRWRAPRRGGRLREDLVGWTVAEAEQLGLASGGALARHGRLLAEGSAAAAAHALADALPEPVDYVLLQADLTAVAPGPLLPALARDLRLLADVESTGGATVYRFTEATVRRAFDVGWTAGDVNALLAGHSRTPVPQPLSYLVEDVARRHGRVRVGAASSFVRCDDEAVLEGLLADRRTAALRLRRIAPTVLASGSPPEVVLDRLRELGLAPAAEGPDGAVVLRPPAGRRTGPRRPAPRATRTSSPPADALLDAAVRAIRGGDRPLLTTLRTGRPTADLLAMLAEAARSGEPLWIGYVDAEGRATQRVVEPVAIDGGYLNAYDHLRGAVRSFAVHRITGVSPVDDETAS
ncbi:MAG TPA: helicase C-terminal domain-containing protein [Actinomycetes bacterium]|jgi:hypothetical protein|nr:helicase C-terminal domain-containing protein [Actinomycetes bacterium]